MSPDEALDLLIAYSVSEDDTMRTFLEDRTGAELENIYRMTEHLQSTIEAILMDRDNRCCEVCSTPIETDRIGRPRQYCSDACRSKAYRDRGRRIQEEKRVRGWG